VWCIECTGADEDILVIRGAPQLFTPTLKQKMINRVMRNDPDAAEAEWNFQYRMAA
jgi:hypothetical protein